MTLRTIEGLTFQVHSPSLLELKSVRDDIGRGDRVFVAYDITGWMIRYVMNDHMLTRSFRSRDEAISLIASRVG